jgi:acyl dehydratase
VSTTAKASHELSAAPITRLGLAFMTAGLEDPNPVHVDEPFARARGLPSVIAHGTLSYGLLGVLIERWVGIEHLKRLSARFVRPAYPDDQLTARAYVDDRALEDGTWRAALEVRNQHDEIVATGWCLLDAHPGGAS